MDRLDTALFTPYGHGYYWNRDLVALHAGSDLVIAAAYFSIAFALVYFARRRDDLEFRPLLLMSAAFVLTSGLTHVFGTWNVWVADYWISGAVRVVAALVSLGAAITLWRFLPTAVTWPSPTQLRAANDELTREMQRRLETINALRESELQLRGAFDYAPIGKATVSLEGRWIKVNQALCRIVGYSEAELLATDFHGITHPDDLAQDLRYIQELIDGRCGRYETEQRYIHKRGHLVWILLSVTLVRDAVNRPDYFIAQIQDITKRKQAELELRQAHAQLETRVAARTRELAAVNRRLAETNRRLELLARTDPLSGLYNRRYLVDMLEKSLNAARRHGVRLSLMLMDVDNFKAINDTHGHLVGDQAITHIGQAIRDKLRDTDVAARIGGDEFCVLATYTGLNDAGAIAEKLRAAVSALEITGNGGSRLALTCSIGIVEWQSGIETVDRLLDLADHALYEAKGLGRNRVACAAR